MNKDAPAHLVSGAKRISAALRGRYLPLFTTGYVALATFLMFRRGSWPTPDQFIIVGLLLALLLARPLTYLKDWSPFVVLFLAYEYLRGLAPSLGWSAHVNPLIRADTFLFGSLPTISLQKLLYSPSRPLFYDYIFTAVYFLHFVLPLGFALVLWTRDRAQFRRFMVALIALSFAGFATYILYPAMPPWMAASQGLIPPVHDVMARTLGSLLTGTGLPNLWAFMDPNQVAAMPSLHAAYPALVYLFAVRFFGKRGHVFLPYALVVWVGIIYMAQHWAIDVLVGVLYAVVVLLSTEFLWARVNRVAQARRARKVPQEGV